MEDFKKKEVQQYEVVWNNCLAIIKDNISPQSYKTWFDPIKPVKLEDNILTIQVPSQFFYEWLEEHFITLLKSTIKKELGMNGRLEYSIVMEQNAKSEKSPYTIKMPTTNKKALRNPSIAMPLSIEKEENKSIPNPFIIPGLKKIKVQSQLNETYSFDNFIEGDCNRLARSAGFAVGNKPGKTSFNPFFLYSNSGLGKTHLAHAIGIQVKDTSPDKTVLYIPAEQFFHQFTESVRNNNVNDFIHFYRMMDVLIVDDVHNLTGKEKTLDVFFHIFNYLHQSNKQLVITSDKPPIELKGFEQRLISRFKWGLVADLQVPDLETRIAIIKKKLYQDGINEISDEVVQYIAVHISTNIRDIEGAIISLLAQSSLNNKVITVELAKQIIDKFIKNTTKQISIDYIQRVISDYFDVPVDIINSNTRKREIVQARQLAMYFSKKLTKSPLATIGMHCGNKDHATVLHACRTVNNLYETDKKFRTYVEEIEKRITSI